MINSLRSSIFTTASIFLFLLIPSLLNAQTGSLKGHVLDKSTNEPLIGANVILEKTSLGIATDVDGNYLIHSIPVGSYTLRVSYVGYLTVTKAINISQDAAAEENILLDAQAITVGVTEVTAQMRGQNQAINQQLTSNTIVNVVSAERIHQLPDASAATALSRLPGVSLMNGDQVVIRGIQAKLNQVLINGIELPSTDMGNAMDNNSTRATNLGFISSNLLDGIEVIKAITPDMDANTLGGVVNLKLREAPTGFHSDVLAQGNYNSTDHLSDNYQFWVSVSDRFLDDKLGVFLQGNMDRTNGGNQTANLIINRFAISTEADRYGNATYETQQATFGFDQNITENSGGSLILDYKLPNGKIVLQNTYSGNLSDNQQNQLNLNFTNSNLNITANRNLFGKELWINALQAENLFGSIKVNATISHSFTQQYTRIAHGPNPNTLFNASSPSPFSPVNDQTFGLSLADACRILDGIDPANPENATGGAGQWVSLDYRSFSQHLYNSALDVSVPITLSDDISGTLKTGGKYVRTTRGNDIDTYRAKSTPDIYANPAANTYFPGVVLSESRFLHFTDVMNTDFSKGQYFLNDFYDFKNGGFRWAIDPAKYDGWVKLSRETWANALQAALSWQDDWNGAEQFSAGYLMGTINIGQKLTILGGARFESYNMIYHANFTQTQHSVMGNAISTANGSIRDSINPVNLYHNVPPSSHNVDRTDNNVFPGVQVQYRMNEWSDIRFAYTNGISRPNYTAIIPKVQFEDGNFNVGNPLLKPSTAQSFDIIGTVHDNTVGLFTVGLFYKEIENATYGTTITYGSINRYTNLWVPDSAFMRDRFNFGIPRSQNVGVTLNNPNLGYIRGIEVDWQTNFWYLPRPFNALVFNVNYTKSWSNTNYTIIRNIVTFETIIVNGRPQQVPVTTAMDTAFTGRLIQQANDVVNANIGIDYKGFSGRLSFRMTGDVLTGVGGRPEDMSYTGNIYGWDFSLKQNLPIEGLSVALNGTNIFHNGIEFYRKYRLKPDAPVTENLVGVLYSPTTYALNLRYSF